MAIIRRADTRNRYVGRAKMLPDSRSPLRLPKVMRAIDSTPSSIRQSRSAGKAEMSCSTADAVDTATVMT
jgi:hypothetical protein